MYRCLELSCKESNVVKENLFVYPHYLNHAPTNTKSNVESKKCFSSLNVLILIFYVIENCTFIQKLLLILH